MSLSFLFAHVRFGLDGTIISHTLIYPEMRLYEIGDYLSTASLNLALGTCFTYDRNVVRHLLIQLTH